MLPDRYNSSKGIPNIKQFMIDHILQNQNPKLNKTSRIKKCYCSVLLRMADLSESFRLLIYSFLLVRLEETFHPLRRA